MPTHRGLWRNWETPKIDFLLARLSANYHRPAGTGSPDRLDASPVRHGQQAFANQLLRVHQIVLIEHNYPKAGDTGRQSRFSCRIPTDASGAGIPITINYDGTTSAPISTQNEVDAFTYTADGAYLAVANAGVGDYYGKRRVIYPQPSPISGPLLASLPPSPPPEPPAPYPKDPG